MYSSLVRHINRFPNANWNYVSLSSHPEVSLLTLKTLKDKPWNWNVLTSHPNWNWNWVRELPDEEWNWVTISNSKHFTWNWVREFPDKPWCWMALSEKDLNMEIVKELQDKPWDWYSLTMGSDISTDDMVKNPNFPWTVNQLLFTKIEETEIRFIRFYRSHYDREAWCDHTSRTPWSIIKNNMDLPWVFEFIKIQHHSEFTEDDVRHLYGRRWNWRHLSETLDFDKVISKCIDRPWEFDFVSKNKTVTYREVLKFPDCKWNYNVINLDLDRREWVAAETIKRYWKRCATDPSYSMCRKIVLGDLFGALDCRNHPSHNES